MANARSLLQNLSPRGRIALAASAIGVLLVAFFMVRLATKPSYTMLNTGLDPAETGKLTSAFSFTSWTKPYFSLISRAMFKVSCASG